MLRGIILLALLSSFLGPVRSQELIHPEIDSQDLVRLELMEDTLSTLSIYMFAQDSQIIRFASCEQFIPMLVRALKITNSFHYPFAELKGISILYPEEENFRIFTWQLEVTREEYRYYGVIQMNSAELRLIPLIDRSFEISDPEYYSSTPATWYGCFYYDIKRIESPGGSYYLLFGYDSHDFRNRRKIAEILRVEDGEITFGLPIFISPTMPEERKRKTRLIVEYKSDALVNLEYLKDRGQIVFDHVVLLDGTGQYVQDGTYEGYDLIDGEWIYVERVFDHIYDEAPRPNPIMESRQGRTIFGTRKKN